jgi:hypothetical protein
MEINLWANGSSIKFSKSTQEDQQVQILTQRTVLLAQVQPHGEITLMFMCILKIR